MVSIDNANENMKEQLKCYSYRWFSPINRYLWQGLEEYTRGLRDDRAPLFLRNYLFHGSSSGCVMDPKGVVQ